MRFVSFKQQDGTVRGGALDGDRIQPLLGDVFTHIAGGVSMPKFSGDFIPLSQVTLLAPLPNARLFCIGLNYRAHAAESQKPVEKVPTVFIKLSSAITGPDSDILLPPEATHPDYEAELAVVIGKRAHRIAAADWEQYVFGYTIVNDVTSREVQKATSQWSLGKSFATFAPMGPHIVTRDEVPDPHALSIRLTLNGERMQDGNTRDLIFRIPDIMAYISGIIALEPGDVISTGTPSGVGMGRTPQRWLKDNEEIVIDIDQIGTLRNRTRVTA
jgi:2-keto-4-pentenoate hydratase/2-oxohepta-3-ene-1,7-dioic acid hydratase in catechol pathway